MNRLGLIATGFSEPALGLAGFAGPFSFVLAGFRARLIDSVGTFSLFWGGVTGLGVTLIDLSTLADLGRTDLKLAEELGVGYGEGRVLPLENRTLGDTDLALADLHCRGVVVGVVDKFNEVAARIQ